MKYQSQKTSNYIYSFLNKTLSIENTFIKTRNRYICVLCFLLNTQISHFPKPLISLDQNRQNFEGPCVGTNNCFQDTIKRSSNVEYVYKIFLQTDGICDEWVFWFLICTDDLNTCGCYFVYLFLEVNFVPLILIVFDYLELSITLKLRVGRLTKRVTHSCTKCSHS